jgi:hypothetical protein
MMRTKSFDMDLGEDDGPITEVEMFRARSDRQPKDIGSNTQRGSTMYECFQSLERFSHSMVAQTGWRY